MRIALRPAAALARCKAVVLALVFAVGPVTTVVADVAHHHLGENEAHSGQHVERPGACLDHGHVCDLGLKHSEHRLPGADVSSSFGSAPTSERVPGHGTAVPARALWRLLAPTRGPPLS